MSLNENKLIQFLRKNQGMASFSEILQAGFHKPALKELVEAGEIEKLDRGLYKLVKGPSPAQPDFVAVSLKAPKAVICLISALAFHEATDEIPKQIDLAIPRGAHANRIHHPPVHYYRFAEDAWKTGIEEHKTAGRHSIRVYTLAKTVADCFKFRNKIGADVAREALRVAVKEKKVKPQEIMKYAKICRVDKIVQPLLEILL